MDENNGDLNKSFASKEEEIKYVIENEELILAAKKGSLQKGDTVHYITKLSNETKDGNAEKAHSEIGEDVVKIGVEVVINTTNVIDSHMDCHIPGIWSKSLMEQGTLFLLQEHTMKFDHIIADSINDNLKAIAKTMSWSELGHNFPGSTQALIFTADVSKERNEFMFEQYRKGYVLNHSVGMRYIKLFLCVDSDAASDAGRKEAWDKYYPSVVNKEIADSKGYFYAVTEGQIIEGSSVVKGSNTITPTLEVVGKDNEPSKGTHKGEPLKDTQKQINYLL